MAARQLSVHPAVRLWLIDLDEPRDEQADARLLSPDEVARADRFVFALHRRRFVAGRASLRRLLATEIDATPEGVPFVYGPAGKPALATAGWEPLWFNLSHSDRFAVVAITNVGHVGVDIEQRRPIADVMRLAQTAFSVREREALEAVDEARRADAFFDGWTRKEAYLKARGETMTGLADFDLSRWTMTSFTPIDGFAGALCLERP
jgi:4'-phosphopantetheinyl transferase